jgi:hypothetical protein
MNKQGSSITGGISAVTGLINLGINAVSNVAIHKQTKNNTTKIMGASLGLSVLAAGISLWQTERIISTIRKETMEGPNK